MKKIKSNDYIKGFRHGVRWMRTYLDCVIQEDYDWDNVEDLDDAIKEAVKSLKAGR